MHAPTSDVARPVCVCVCVIGGRREHSMKRVAAITAAATDAKVTVFVCVCVPSP